MIRTPALVEIHYAVWAVLAIPLGLAGTFFLMPGLLFMQAGILLTAAGLLIFYIISWPLRNTEIKIEKIRKRNKFLQ